MTLHKPQDNTSYYKLINKYRVYLLYFGAKWCKACTKVSPFIEQLSNKIKGVGFIYLDVDIFKPIAQNAQIKEIPQFILYENKKHKKRIKDPRNLEKELKPYASTFSAFSGTGNTLSGNINKSSGMVKKEPNKPKRRANNPWARADFVPPGMRKKKKVVEEKIVEKNDDVVKDDGKMDVELTPEQQEKKRQEEADHLLAQQLARGIDPFAIKDDGNNNSNDGNNNSNDGNNNNNKDGNKKDEKKPIVINEQDLDGMDQGMKDIVNKMAKRSTVSNDDKKPKKKDQGKKIADMTSEEKQQWLEMRRKQVRKKKEKAKQDKVKEKEKNRRDLGRAAIDLKRQREQDEMAAAVRRKKKEEAQRKAARKAVKAKIAAAKEERKRKREEEQRRLAARQANK